VIQEVLVPSKSALERGVAHAGLVEVVGDEEEVVD